MPKTKILFQCRWKAVGIKVNVLFTDGSQPIGRGIGPALEAMDVECFAKRNWGTQRFKK
jgi:thymidine phosphorylase